MRSKYSRLLEDGQFRRWYEDVARGSHTTADVYLRHLGHFLVSSDLSARGLVRLKPGPLYHLLLDAVTAMEERQLSGGYITAILKSVKSWLSFNGVVLARRIRVRGARETPTLRDERVPSQEELRKVFLSGDEKARTVCALLAHSGLRPEVLGAYRGVDGLQLRDLPELIINGGTVAFRKVPTMVQVRPQLSKMAHQYFTFLSEEGCEYLRAYLELRIRSGEAVTPEAAVIRPKTAKNPFITTTNIGDAARTALRRAGFPWRPYVLRSYFATQMMLAESKGLIIRDYRTFFMGHRGDIEAVYTLNKRQLPPDVVEQMRECYAKVQKYLQTVPPKEGADDVARALKRQLLLVAGLEPAEITDAHLGLDEEAFQKLVRDRLLGAANSGPSVQKVVALGALDAHLAQGWEFVSLLPNDKAVVRRSAAA